MLDTLYQILFSVPEGCSQAFFGLIPMIIAGIGGLLGNLFDASGGGGGGGGGGKKKKEDETIPDPFQAVQLLMANDSEGGVRNLFTDAPASSNGIRSQSSGGVDMSIFKPSTVKQSTNTNTNTNTSVDTSTNTQTTKTQLVEDDLAPEGSFYQYLRNKKTKIDPNNPPSPADGGDYYRYLQERQ